MSSSHPALLASLAWTALATAGCTGPGVMLSDASHATDAAAFPGPDAGPDAAVGANPDAEAAPDAPAPIDGGPPPAGCFERSVRVAESSVTGRPRTRIHGAASLEDGWAVVASGLSDRALLLVLDREGTVLSETPLEFDGGALHADGNVVYLLSWYWVFRFDLAEGRVARAYPSEFIGGTGPRHEGVRAFEALPGGGLRVLSHFYDETARRSILRLSEIVRDDAAETGIRQQTSDLADFDGPDPFYDARYYLAGDHLRVLSGLAPSRVMDVQLGLGAVGSGVIGVRVWSDEAWADGPDGVVGLTRDRTAALTARTDEAPGVVLAHVEPLPPATGDPVLLDGLDLRFGTLGASMVDLEEGRILVASYDGLHVFDRGSGARVGEPVALEAMPNVGMLAMRRGNEAAAVFVESDGRSVAMRCLRLPPR